MVRWFGLTCLLVSCATLTRMANPRPLIRAHRIAARCKQLGRRIAKDLAGQRAVILPVLDGAFVFAADLVRCIPLPDLELRFIAARSYLGTESTGTVEYGAIPDLAGRHVVLVEDVLDTGRTLAGLIDLAFDAGADSVRICTLLDKPARRVVEVTADYVGFTIPDRFVVGYGLDHDGRWRHLPDVCVMD